MKNKFIGYICLLYSLIALYVCLTGKLGYFLAPQMHKYVYISLPILILMFLTVKYSGIHYHFRLSDLILLLPLIGIILAGDCKLSLSYSSNSLGNFANKEKEEEKIVVEILPEEKEKKEETEEEKEEIEEVVKELDFSKPDFHIKDDTFVSLTEYLSFDKKATYYEGKTIKMRGFTVENTLNIPNGYNIFGKLQISCCAADSFISGMLIKYENKLKPNTWYEVEGTLEKVPDNEYYHLAIKVVNIKQISEEEMYVYPCYAYGDGSCKTVTDYNLK